MWSRFVERENFMHFIKLFDCTERRMREIGFQRLPFQLSSMNYSIICRMLTRKWEIQFLWFLSVSIDDNVCKLVEAQSGNVSSKLFISGFLKSSFDKILLEKSFISLESLLSSNARGCCLRAKSREPFNNEVFSFILCWTFMKTKLILMLFELKSCFHSPAENFNKNPL